jgi:hypothetical protein
MSKYPIQRISSTVLIDVSEDADLGTTTEVAANGLLSGILVLASDLDDTDTYTLTLKDQDGYTVFTRASLAESVRTAIYVDTNNHPLRLPLTGTYTIEVLASGDQAADRAFSVTLLVDRG